MYNYASYICGMPCMYPTSSSTFCPMNPYMRCPMDSMQMPTYQNYLMKDNYKHQHKVKSNHNNFQHLKMRTIDINDIIN